MACRRPGWQNVTRRFDGPGRGGSLAGGDGPTNRLRPPPDAGRCQDQRAQKLTATTRLNGSLDWPGVAPVCRIKSEVKKGGQETYEVSSAITGVPRSRADAATRLSWHRGHWGIENRLHWVRDETMGEDANQTRVGSGPPVLAV